MTNLSWTLRKRLNSLMASLLSGLLLLKCCFKATNRFFPYTLSGFIPPALIGVNFDGWRQYGLVIVGSMLMGLFFKKKLRKTRR